jgi:hypothetical protein
VIPASGGTFDIVLGASSHNRGNNRIGYVRRSARAEMIIEIMMTIYRMSQRGEKGARDAR